MFRRRRDETLRDDAYQSATAYYGELRQGMREKADHNKLEAQGCFAASIGCTLIAPLFVTLGDGVLLGKVVPATLSVVAAALTTWLQVRKPHRLWVVYRRAQRELEREKNHFDHGLGNYDGDKAVREKMLATRVGEIAFWAHEQWEGLVPEPDMLATGPARPIATKERNQTDATTDRPIATEDPPR